MSKDSEKKGLLGKMTEGIFGEPKPYTKKFTPSDEQTIRDPDKKLHEKLEAHRHLRQDEDHYADKKINKRKRYLNTVLIGTLCILGALAYVGILAGPIVFFAALCLPMAKGLGDMVIDKISTSAKKLTRSKYRGLVNDLDIHTLKSSEIDDKVLEKSERFFGRTPNDLSNAKDKLEKARVEKQIAELKKEINQLSQTDEQFKTNNISDRLLKEFGISSNDKDSQTIATKDFNGKIEDQATKGFIAQQVADLRDDSKTSEEKTTARRILTKILQQYNQHNEKEEANSKAYDDGIAAGISAYSGVSSPSARHSAPTKYTKKPFTLDQTKQGEIQKNALEKTQPKSQATTGKALG